MKFHFSRGDGQALMEYGLVLAFVAVAVIVILALLGPKVGEFYSDIVANIP